MEPGELAHHGGKPSRQVVSFFESLDNKHPLPQTVLITDQTRLLFFFFFSFRTSAKLMLNGKEEDGQHLHVNILGEQHIFELFAVLEFTSDRKRMSVVVRDPR